MKNDLLKVAIRQQALFVPKDRIGGEKKDLSQATTVLLVNLRKLGFSVSEELLHALNQVTPAYQVAVFDTLKEILGVDLNWSPLVKGWDTPTGETVIDHIITLFANVFQLKNGTRLPCGHLIPENTFPLERYNGCPFCGTPFEFAEIENFGQGSKLKVLNLWTEDKLTACFIDLLESRTALDATQADSLKILVRALDLPEVEIKMKETQIMAIDWLIENKEYAKAQQFISSPNDILRYLWYMNTGFLQIIEPKTIINRAGKNHAHRISFLDRSDQAKKESRDDLRLKYNRTECHMVATWLNNLNMNVENACEIMHPKRGMWVRFIRALRLAEYARKPGFEYLKQLMDVFYNQTYPVFQGKVEGYRLKCDAEKTFALLKQRPGLFARSLFANMLWFGAEDTTAAFGEVIDKVPARLIFTLNMYAPNYFNPRQNRAVKPLGGIAKTIGSNRLLSIYNNEQLEIMISKVEDLCIKAVSTRFAKIATDSKTMFIDPVLFKIPLSIGDRSETIQDLPSALKGTRFPVEGNAVRLFMQWGEGLPAQHLDMDLSCHIALSKTTEVCSYYHLTASGAKHSGDIRSIPDKIGTAEYIELDLEKLISVDAKYVIFSCNAYSNGSLSPNLVVGWMNSVYPMKISEKTGVAYDPSCVQHQVRVTQNAAKGLVFGILDVAAHEIVWLEMPYGEQTIEGMSTKGVEALLAKLNSKTSIGHLLEIKAEAQHIEIVETREADEVYTQEWAMNTAAVTKLLID